LLYSFVFVFSSILLSPGLHSASLSKVDELCAKLAKIEVVGNAGEGAGAPRAGAAEEESSEHGGGGDYGGERFGGRGRQDPRRCILYNIGNKLWALNVMKLLNAMHEFAMESVVLGKFGVHSVRIFRLLSQIGYLDDDAVSARLLRSRPLSRPAPANSCGDPRFYHRGSVSSPLTLARHHSLGPPPTPSLPPFPLQERQGN
jgi:hypothetical protein